MSISRQQRLFKLALAELANLDDLVNKAMEVFEDDEGGVHH
jgi:hypothetical protein